MGVLFMEGMALHAFCYLDPQCWGRVVNGDRLVTHWFKMVEKKNGRLLNPLYVCESLMVTPSATAEIPEGRTESE